MKKLLAILLSLMFLLPAIALGEAAEAVDTYDVEFDDFTLHLTSYDIIQKAAAKEDNAILFMLYPDYDETAATHNNISCVWTQYDLLPELPDMDAEAFGQQVVAGIVQQMNTTGASASNPQLLAAEKVDGVGLVLYYSMDMDYSGLGVDLQTTIYQAQLYIGLGEKGTYVFTPAAADMNSLVELVTYLQTIEFKQ